MAITDLFRQTVTLLRTETTTRDAIGGASVGTTSSTIVKGYLEPKSGDEELTDRNTQIGDWTLFLPAGTDVTSWDRVTYEGHTFDILAPPRPFFDPRAEAEHHLEVDLREVT